jgi:DNA sulfur modification protein DndC
MASELDERIKDAHFSLTRLLEQGRSTWAVMCSGGKDSTATAAVALIFAAQYPDLVKEIILVHADTGVENPAVLDAYARFAKSARDFADRRSLNLHAVDVSPEPQRRFFAQMLTRGLPPPNPKFRWCTRDLKIRPAQAWLRQHVDPAKTAVLVGLRFGESEARDQRLNTSCSKGAECGHGSWLDKQRPNSFQIVSPIASWRTCHVWDFLRFEAPRAGLETAHLFDLYSNADFSRFGCWTCTLVERDNSMLNLISKPAYQHLAPLLWFHERLARLQHDPAAQDRDEHGRRLGLSLAVRKQLLAEITILERVMGMQILSPGERAFIESALERESNDQKREYSHVTL